MAGHTKLDGAGQAKLKTLDDAQIMLQRVHNIVEQYALAVKRGQSTGSLLMNLKRQFPSLASLLKGQFGMIADQVFALNLMVSRGSNEAMRVRQMREGVGSIRQGIDIMIHHVAEKHAVPDEPEEPKIPIRRVTVKQVVREAPRERKVSEKTDENAEDDETLEDDESMENEEHEEGEENTDTAAADK